MAEAGRQSPAPLDDLAGARLTALRGAMVALAGRRRAVRKVDGTIIGTGVRDFTADNACYTLQPGPGSAFQLYDVPGIEGNEQRYATMIRHAVAKAHLVIYVNGSNKKPEKATAEKIGAYLKRGTQVCPIVNVRGNADLYEFADQRLGLGADGRCEKALAQTVQVLQDALGDGVLLPGHCVQGLLGFSALAWHGSDSTIHPSREDDLVLHQRKYLKHFGSPQAMLAFSQVDRIAGVLEQKRKTFRHDIVESNKGKVRELLAENIGALEQMLAQHRRFMKQVEPEFTKCRDTVGAALETFERMLGAGRKNLWAGFFNTLSEHAEHAVRAHFGDSGEIGERIEEECRKLQAAIGRQLGEQLAGHLATLEAGLQQATMRLVEDVQRVDLQQRFQAGSHAPTFDYRFTRIDMDLGAREWGSIAVSVGGYALSGGTIGSTFLPGIGSAIGAAVGALVGVLVNIVGYVAGKEQRIRNAQRQAQQTIEELRARVLAGLPAELDTLTGPVRSETDASVLGWVEAMHADLARPLDIMTRQVARMKATLYHLEKMPYGAIQAVQH